MNDMTKNNLCAAAIGFAGAFPAAADVPVFVETFKDCAVGAMEKISGALLEYDDGVTPDLRSGSVGISGVVPTDIGSISMSVVWVWNEAAKPPVSFNAEGIIETYFGIDQAYAVELLGVPVVVAHRGTGAAEAVDGQATARLYSGESLNPDFISYVLDKSRAMNDAMLSCGRPSFS